MAKRKDPAVRDLEHSLIKEHNSNEKPHKFIHHLEVIELLERILDSRPGRELTYRRIARLMEAGYHPDCPRCQANLRRSWREYIKTHQSTHYDYHDRLPGMSRATANYERVSANTYRSVIRDEDDD